MIIFYHGQRGEFVANLLAVTSIPRPEQFAFYSINDEFRGRHWVYRFINIRGVQWVRPAHPHIAGIGWDRDVVKTGKKIS